MEEVINVKNLSKTFGRNKAVDHLNLTVQSGEIFGFLGPNGGGKTTTLRLLCGLLIPDSGEGTCLGFDILTESYQIKKNIGYMTQSFGLYTELTLRENLNFIAQLYDVKDRKNEINKTIESLGLKEYEHQLVEVLSGGWKQRLALAAALIHKPKLLLLDEPTAGVDPKARHDFWGHIDMLSKQGVTTLVSTHYMDEAERCHKLGYISQGKLLVHGTKQDIMKKYTDCATLEQVFIKLATEYEERKHV